MNEELNNIISALCSSAIESMPPDWNEGVLTVEFDGRKLTYSLKNPNSPTPAKLRTDLPVLAEQFVVHFLNSGSPIERATFDLSNHEGEWEFKVALKYPGDDDEGEELGDELTENLEDTVHAFISDFDDWNTAAMSFNDAGDEDKVDESYAKLVATHFVPNKEPSGAAFGTSSAHSLPEEKIMQMKKREDGYWVSTVHTDPDSDFKNDYLYHLVEIDGVLKIQELYYVDADGRYPSV